MEEIFTPDRSNANKYHLVFFRIYFFALLFMSSSLFGQSPPQDKNIEDALNTVTRSISGYFDASTRVIYAISAIIGLVGAIKVYSKWNSGDPDTQKVAAAWFGACIFLVVIASVIKTFFGVDVLMNIK